ncbi:putative serine/arginine repetitive matrix protein 1 isoform X1 [Iris pallida]|uniref:Serine/arginine repetitive matrix protein 1 isoform X1 n=1 Tax=Iris pallida TaxID=29817 RepID=A0AAX6DT82_IRIPA|nr:putative serine/arginine repetitive matrix protein 1 isoform X1 [Iris pallida]
MAVLFEQGWVERSRALRDSRWAEPPGDRDLRRTVCGGELPRRGRYGKARRPEMRWTWPRGVRGAFRFGVVLVEMSGHGGWCPHGGRLEKLAWPRRRRSRGLGRLGCGGSKSVAGAGRRLGLGFLLAFFVDGAVEFDCWTRERCNELDKENNDTDARVRTR